MNSTLKTATMWFRFAAQGLKHHYLTHPAKMRAGNARRQDDRPREDGKCGQKANHHRDLLHHRLDGLNHIGNVDHRHRRVGVKERPLHRPHLLGIHMHRAVPDHRQPGQRPRRQDEFTAPEHMLAIVANNRSHVGLDGSSIRGQHDVGAEMQIEPLRNVFGHGKRLRIALVPPVSRHH